MLLAQWSDAEVETCLGARPRAEELAKFRRPYLLHSDLPYFHCQEHMNKFMSRKSTLNYLL
jgi:hypothetical protein